MISLIIKDEKAYKINIINKGSNSYKYKDIINNINNSF